MTDSSSSGFDIDSLFGPTVAFSVGALAAGYAALTAWTTAYINANPAVGSVSGGSTFVVVLFLAGVASMFLAANAALHRALD